MRLTTILFAAVISLPCSAADPPTVEKLIEQLGSRQFAERERATKLLRERGPAALPALRKALESKDEEIRKRAEVLVPPLEIEEALLPKRVTIKAVNQSVSDVLRDSEKQFACKVVVPGKIDRKLTLDLRDVPFWEALDRIGEELGRTVSWQNYSKTLQLLPSPGRSPHVNIQGPFRLEATMFHEDRDVDFTRAKADSSGWRSSRLTLALSVLAEPRITFLRVEPARLTEAIDADGKSLKDDNDQVAANVDQRHGRPSFRGEFLFTSDVRLRRASETAKTAKIIRGTIPVKMILIRKPVVVASKVLESAGTTFRAGTEGLQITRVNDRGNGRVEVEIAVPRDESAQNWQWSDRFSLEDDAGVRFEVNGGGGRSDGRGHWISIYYAPPSDKKAGPPTKLIFEDWVIHDYAIPFEFKNVPLP